MIGLVWVLSIFAGGWYAGTAWTRRHEHDELFTQRPSGRGTRGSNE